MEKFNIEGWTQEFKSAEVQQMDEEKSRVLLAVMMDSYDKEMLRQHFLYQVCSSRAETIGLKADEKIVDFLSIVSKTPGEVVMYLNFLRQVQVEKKRISMDEFCCQLFPYGFPTEKEMNRLWDLQKTSTGNGLDSINWG